MVTTLMQIKNEMINFLRNQDIISTSDRGVTTSQDTGTFSADLTHTLATNPTLVKNVRSVVVGGSTLSYGSDYTFSYSTGLITFTSAQTGAYTIDYDQGTNDRIWPDYPQPHLKVSNFPRIAIDILGGNSEEVGIGATLTESTYQMTAICYDKDHTDVENLVSDVKTAIINNKKNFYYSKFISPTGVGPILVSEWGQKKILQRNQDFDVRFNYDESS